MNLSQIIDYTLTLFQSILTHRAAYDLSLQTGIGLSTPLTHEAHIFHGPIHEPVLHQPA